MSKDKRETKDQSTQVEDLSDLQLTAEQAQDNKAGTESVAYTRHEGAFMGNLFSGGS